MGKKVNVSSVTAASVSDRLTEKKNCAKKMAPAKRNKVMDIFFMMDDTMISFYKWCRTCLLLIEENLNFVFRVHIQSITAVIIGRSDRLVVKQNAAILCNPSSLLEILSLNKKGWSIIFTINQPFAVCSHQDSNLGLRLRRPTLYPLSYGNEGSVFCHNTRSGSRIHRIYFKTQFL